MKSIIIATFFLIVIATSCRKEIYPDGSSFSGQAKVATQWADLTLSIFKNSYRNSPTYSSRSLAYLGICMYECVVHADSSLRSLKNQLNGLNTLPDISPDLEYNWKVVLNEGQRTMLKLLYPVNENIGEAYFKIDELAEQINTIERINFPYSTVERSSVLGKDIAMAIYEWSKNDGGFKGYNKNFDSSFYFPVGESFWVPPINGQSPSRFPLHPYWGSNRAFVNANGLRPAPAMEVFSTDTSANYYKLHKEVYLKRLSLTQFEKEIAAWWGDDPSETFSPPGHSYNLATIAVKRNNSTLAKAAEGYARVGLAVSDAFIYCWKSKYTYFNQRPSSFIRANIDSLWTPYWPEPPFPAFPSGHALQAAATAAVLTDLYGNNFSFVDNSHEGRKGLGVEYKSRAFQNFWEFAEECAFSRLLGGIHTRQDNDAGLTEGRKIGNSINQLMWYK